MNNLASQVKIGADGVSIIPFGNGAERILQNREISASVHGINYNIHDKRHLMRAAQEGIVFSFKYGMEISGKYRNRYSYNQSRTCQHVFESCYLEIHFPESLKQQ